MHELSVANVCLTFVTPWTEALQAPLSIEFSRPEYLSESPFPSPGDLPKPGIKPGSLALQADSLPIELRGKHSLKLRIFVCLFYFIIYLFGCVGS